MAAALNRNSWIDYVASAVATLGLTIPVFVTSMLLILVFAVWLKWLPASGWPDPERWILPIVAYAAIPIATYARYTRSAMLDTAFLFMSWEISLYDQFTTFAETISIPTNANCHFTNPFAIGKLK